MTLAFAIYLDRIHPSNYRKIIDLPFVPESGTELNIEYGNNYIRLIVNRIYIDEIISARFINGVFEPAEYKYAIIGTQVD